MNAGIARGIVLLAALLLAACIPIPYKPSAQVVPDASIAIAPTSVVISAEDETTKALAKKIAAHDRKITVVPHEAIAGVAFAEGDVALGELLRPDRCTRLQQNFGLSHVVLVGDLGSQELSHHGGFIPLLGAGTWTEMTNLAASVIDLATARALTGVTATTKASGGGVIYGFWGLFLVPMSETSAYDGVAKGIVAAIRGSAGQGPVKIFIAHVIGDGVGSCTDGVECSTDSP
jgi:hypothetical protein